MIQSIRTLAPHSISAASKAPVTNPAETSQNHTKATAESSEKQDQEKSQATAQQFSEQERQQVDELKKRDREVHIHEAAHKAVGGSLTGGISFEFQQGPDGRRYAVGGEVSIDTSKVAGDALATLAKANRIRAAALAPADPSSQDRAVAAKAGSMATEARAELAKQQQAQAESDEGPRERRGVKQYEQTLASDNEKTGMHLIA